MKPRKYREGYRAKNIDDKRRKKMKTIKSFVIIVMILFLAVPVFTETIRLNTADLNECIGITTFLTNTKGEIFLFSHRMSKIFKFNKNGEFEKSFCRDGIGPGEVKRALWMYHNPSNDFLYLPEMSSSIFRITVFDSDGNFKNYLDIEISPTLKDNISKMIFLDDGSFYAMVSERKDVEPYSGIYLTRDKYSLLYFDKTGKLKARIFELIKNDEMSSGPGWGGPGILFRPSIVVRNTPEGNVCLAKTDENILNFYDKNGTKLGTTTLDIKRELLSDSEFKEAKAELIELSKKDLRMQDLAKKMIQLKYKPIYSTLWVIKDRYVISKQKKDSPLGFTKETTLTFFDKNGKRLASKNVNGFVLGITNSHMYVKEYDEDTNEFFRIEEFK
jgi:hypothetical protein